MKRFRNTFIAGSVTVALAGLSGCAAPVHMSANKERERARSLEAENARLKAHLDRAMEAAEAVLGVSRDVSRNAEMADQGFTFRDDIHRCKIL
jgi:hypothetical protein